VRLNRPSRRASVRLSSSLNSDSGGSSTLVANVDQWRFKSHFRNRTPVAKPVRKAMDLSEIAMLPKKLRRRISRTRCEGGGCTV
jgi:hypothetical protein